MTRRREQKNERLQLVKERGRKSNMSKQKMKKTSSKKRKKLEKKEVHWREKK